MSKYIVQFPNSNMPKGKNNIYCTVETGKMPKIMLIKRFLKYELRKLFSKV